MNFGELVGLEGVKRKKELPAFFVSNAKQIPGALKKDMTCTASDTNGSINAYKDDDGFYRFQLQKFCVTIEKKIFTNLASLQREFSFGLKKIK